MNPTRTSSMTVFHTRRVRALALATLSLLVLVGVGCSRPFADGDAQLQIASRDQADRTSLTMAGEFTRAFYRFKDQNTLTLILIQGPDNAPHRIAAIDMFWKARAGLTPIDRTATNARVRFFEFRDTEAEPNTIGVYAGAGFMRLHDNPTVGTVDGNLWDADLRLTDRSEDYIDRLGRAVLAGSFTAERDDARVTSILRELNQQLEERLGYPRLVESDVSLSEPRYMSAALPFNALSTTSSLIIWSY